MNFSSSLFFGASSNVNFCVAHGVILFEYCATNWLSLKDMNDKSNFKLLDCDRYWSQLDFWAQVLLLDRWCSISKSIIHVTDDSPNVSHYLSSVNLFSISTDESTSQNLLQSHASPLIAIFAKPSTELDFS